MMEALETEAEYLRGVEEEGDISTTSRFMLFCRKMMTTWESETEENNLVVEDPCQECEVLIKTSQDIPQQAEHLPASRLEEMLLTCSVGRKLFLRMEQSTTKLFC